MVFTKDSNINLKDLPRKTIPLLSYEEAKSLMGKGWNYINVYDLLKLKKSYIAVLNHNVSEGKKSFYHEFQKLVSEKMETRNMDEYLNALKCFDIVKTSNDKEILIINKAEFNIEYINNLDNNDIIFLTKCYFNYIRFKYFHNWLIGNILSIQDLKDLNEIRIKNQSEPVFSFSEYTYFDTKMHLGKSKKRKLIDSFFYTLQPSEYYQFNSSDTSVSKEEKVMMRFWEVFTEWGRKLKILEKINLTDTLDVSIKIQEKKTLFVTYLIKDFSPFLLSDVIKQEYPKNIKSVPLAELTIKIALNTQFSIPKIHEEIIKQCLSSNGLYSLQRTSAIFLDGKEYIYPKVGNSYISHIFIR